MIAAAYLVLIESILRHPLVAVVGAESEPFLIEAVVAVIALLLLFVLLGWIYRAARPIIEELAWQTLDAALATSSSEEVQRAASTLGPAVTPTLVAPGAPTPAGATIVRDYLAFNE